MLASCHYLLLRRHIKDFHPPPPPTHNPPGRLTRSRKSQLLISGAGGAADGDSKKRPSSAPREVTWPLRPPSDWPRGAVTSHLVSLDRNADAADCQEAAASLAFDVADVRNAMQIDNWEVASLNASRVLAQTMSPDWPLFSRFRCQRITSQSCFFRLVAG